MPPRTSSAIPNSVRTLAAALGCTRKTVEKLLKAGLQRNPDGTFNVEDAREQLRVQGMRQKGGAIRTKEVGRIDELIKRAKLKAVMLDLDERERRLIERQAVKQDWDSKALAVKQTLISLPREYAQRLVGKSAREIEAILTAALYEKLRGLAQNPYANTAAVTDHA